MNEYVLPNLFFLISTAIFLIALGLILPSYLGMDKAKYEEKLMMNEAKELKNNTKQG